MHHRVLALKRKNETRERIDVTAVSIIFDNVLAP